MPSENIQWFPGHMAKTRRLIKENLKYVDIIIEVLDAAVFRKARRILRLSLFQTESRLFLFLTRRRLPTGM